MQDVTLYIQVAWYSKLNASKIKILKKIKSQILNDIWKASVPSWRVINLTISTISCRKHHTILNKVCKLQNSSGRYDEACWNRKSLTHIHLAQILKNCRMQSMIEERFGKTSKKIFFDIAKNLLPFLTLNLHLLKHFLKKIIRSL